MERGEFRFFFRGPENGPESIHDKRQGRDRAGLAEGLGKIVARLIRSGHVDAWEYGWAFTKIAIDELAEAESMNMKMQAVSVQRAISAVFSKDGAKSFMKFLE